MHTGGKKLLRAEGPQVRGASAGRWQTYFFPGDNIKAREIRQNYFDSMQS